MTDLDRVTFNSWPSAKQPGWERKTVMLDGEVIGHLDRHETAEDLEWLIAAPDWRAVEGEQRRHHSRDSAVAALVRAAEARRG